MATTLNKRTVVIVGGGLTAALVARQLTAKGTDVLLLERGYDRRKSAEAKLPNQRDELRWDIRGGLGQNWAVETYTVRHSPKDEALPARRLPDSVKTLRVPDSVRTTLSTRRSTSDGKLRRRKISLEST